MRRMKSLTILVLLISTIACDSGKDKRSQSHSASEDTAGTWYSALPADLRAKGVTPLMWASGYGDTAKVNALLAKKADVHATDADGWTALHHAALGGDGPLSSGLGSSHSQVMQALIAGGADVNAKTMNGETTLPMAAAKGQADWVRVLIGSGADINAKNSLGETPLIAAASKGHSDEDAEETIEILLQAGADVTQKDPTGWTALRHAKDQRRYRIVKLLQAAGATR